MEQKIDRFQREMDQMSCDHLEVEIVSGILSGCCNDFLECKKCHKQLKFYVNDDIGYLEDSISILDKQITELQQRKHTLEYELQEQIQNEIV